MKHFMGIDPGQKGAIAVINEMNDIVFLSSFSRENMIQCIQELNGVNIVACVEKVSAMPGQGVTSMFNFGKGAGYIEGVLEYALVPYQLVPPNKWKGTFSLLHKGKDDSIRVCKNLFPKANLYPTERCRKESDGMAEALLLAEYAKRKF